MAPSDWQPGGGFLPPSSRPRPVRGGIRMQSRRGGTEWWSRRWLATFEAAAVGDRLAQGLEDARRGQVLELDLALGRVEARVQGTRREPHVAIVRLPSIEQAAWLRLAQAIAARGASRSELLSRQMPEDIEAAVRREGLSLFPMLEDDAELACTCDDWATPCRHVLAACLLVSEAMDADPLLAFLLRGIEPDLLRTLVTGIEAPAETTSTLATGAASAAHAAIDPVTFWTGMPAPPTDLAAPSIDAPLVRILGAPPLWRGADSFEPAMRRIYARIASDPRTIDLALGGGDE